MGISNSFKYFLLETCSRLTSNSAFMFSDVSKLLKKFEKKCDLSPAFFFEVVFLYPSVKPKSNIKFEFLNA